MNYADNRKFIVASLQEGKIISRLGIGFIYFSLVLCVFMIALSFYISSMEKRYDFLMCLVLPGIGIPILIYILVKNYRLLMKVKLWMKDAVECQADVITIDSRIPPWIGNRRTFKIQVNFIYRGKKIVKISGEGNIKRKGLYCVLYNGYDSVFRKYTNRKIKIAYSPRYDQVLILRD